MSVKTLTLSAAFGLSLASIAIAQTNTAAPHTPVDPASIDMKQRMSMAYARMSDPFFKDLLPPQDMLKLFLITKQQVLATMCEGFDIDEAKLTQALNTAMGETMLSDAANILIFGRVMHGYGIIKGGEVALATYDPDAYCAYGADLREQLLTEEGGAVVNVLKPTD